MWNKVGARLNVHNEWQTAETSFLGDMIGFMNDTQKYQDNFWVIANAGSGKTEAVRRFRQTHKNVFVINCRNYNQRELVYLLAAELGIQKKSNMRYRDLENSMIKRIQELDCPLLVFDEADKLKKDAFDFLTVLYNEVKNAGFFCCSTPAMIDIMERLRRKPGGEELFSRFGKELIRILPPNDYDVEVICRANYVTTDAAINRVKKAAEKAGYDMRAVFKAIRKEWEKMAA